MMLLDAGSVRFVIADARHASVAIIFACLCIVLVGTITLTSAVIGYVTTYISDFIASANTGARRLHISGHMVILNWNFRASESINDMLITENKEKIVILVSENREQVEKEIEDHLLDMLEKRAPRHPQGNRPDGYFRGMELCEKE